MCARHSNLELNRSVMSTASDCLFRVSAPTLDAHLGLSGHSSSLLQGATHKSSQHGHDTDSRSVKTDALQCASACGSVVTNLVVTNELSLPPIMALLIPAPRDRLSARGPSYIS